MPAFDAEPRLLVFDAEPRLSFSEKKNEPRPSRDPSQTSPSRTETLAKRARAELRLLQNLPSRNDAFLKLHFNTNFYIFHFYINLKK